MARYKRNFSLVILIAIFSLCSCCGGKQPEWPTASKIPGWQVQHERGVEVTGKFALKKGESTENDVTGISVIDISSGSWLADRGSYNGSAKVTLRFYSVSTKSTLCEITITTGSSMLNSGGYCRESLGFSVINIEAINTAEQWVWFTVIK